MRVAVVSLGMALVGLCALGSGCGPRLGSSGETCSRTADCAAPLRCIEFRCVSVGEPPRAPAARTPASESTEAPEMDTSPGPAPTWLRATPGEPAPTAPSP